MRRAILLTLAATAFLALQGFALQQKDDPKPHDADHHDGPAEHVVITPDKIKWEDAKMLPAGAKLAVLDGDPAKEGFFTIRAKLPAGYRIPPHWHPGVERVTVLSGTLHIGPGERIDEKTAAKLSVGSYTAMPKGVRHFAYTDGETEIQISSIGPWGITYVNPADDPRKAAGSDAPAR
jgi:quercetin dioxygenase-like cupin family protein